MSLTFSRRQIVGGLAGLPLVATPSSMLLAQSKPSYSYDAALITGLDFSSSMFTEPHNRFIPTIEGLIAALSNEQLLRRLTGGPLGRCLFGLYKWGNAPYEIIDFQPLDAEAPIVGMMPVILELQKILHQAKQGIKIHLETTNTASAMRFGVNRLVTNRHLYRDAVLNLFTDDDNSRGDGALSFADPRKQALENNITINGMILGDPDVKLGGEDHYFHRFIKLGDRAFVMNAELTNMEQAWFQKFNGDVAALWPASRRIAV